MTVTEMRRSALAAAVAGVRVEMDPTDVLALLNEVERLRAKLVKERKP